MADILVVDDESGIRNILSEILRDSGYYVSCAANAQEAQELVKSRKFSLVLLDVWMPGKDGLQLLREWNATRQLDFPVIMMSGHATIQSAKQALLEGAVDFLEKPLSLKILLQAIGHALAQWHEKMLSEAVRRNNPQRSQQGRRPSHETGAQRPRLPVFELSDYNLTLDFNKTYREALLAFERAYFLTVLGHVDHSVAELSRHSGLERTHLYRKMRMLGIDMGAYREASKQGGVADPREFTHEVEASAYRARETVDAEASIPSISNAGSSLARRPRLPEEAESEGEAEGGERKAGSSV